MQSGGRGWLTPDQQKMERFQMLQEDLPGTLARRRKAEQKVLKLVNQLEQANKTLRLLNIRVEDETSERDALRSELQRKGMLNQREPSPSLSPPSSSSSSTSSTFNRRFSGIPGSPSNNYNNNNNDNNMEEEEDIFTHTPTQHVPSQHERSQHAASQEKTHKRSKRGGSFLTGGQRRAYDPMEWGSIYSQYSEEF